MSIEQFMEQVENSGGQAFFVGGFVRDRIMGFTSKDKDVEVFGLSREDLEVIMSLHGTFKVSIVDGTFIYKLTLTDTNETIDISQPRRERSTGAGDNDFEFESDPTMTMEEAAIRRDVTMNAIYMDRHGDITDPFDGIGAINSKIIRAISERFVESPVRVLRVMQFAARFDFAVSRTVIQFSRTMSPVTIAKERIFEEFSKLLQRGIVPNRGFSFLRASGWISHFPILNDLIGCEQEFSHHPEGDVWNHTLQVVDRMHDICERDNITGFRKQALMWAALLHDIGKPATTAVINGKITSHGHDDVGADMARDFLTDLRAPNNLIEAVEIMVREHMALIRIPTNNTRAVRRLVRRLGPVSIEDWARVLEADASGRFPKPASAPGNAFVETAKSINIETKINNDILMGRHLILMGMIPGPEFKVILDAARNAQDDEVFTNLEDAMNWVRENFNV